MLINDRCYYGNYTIQFSRRIFIFAYYKKSSESEGQRRIDFQYMVEFFIGIKPSDICYVPQKVLYLQADGGGGTAYSDWSIVCANGFESTVRRRSITL